MSFKSMASKQKINLGTIEDGKLNYQGVLEDRDKSHLLKFKLANRSSHNFQLRNLEKDADLKLLSRRGNVLYKSQQPGIAKESISETLKQGTYYIKVHLNEKGASSYTLTASSTDSQERQQSVVNYVPGDGISAEEMKLYKLVNRYRVSQGVPKISLSKALSTVANRHVLDLNANIGFATHSWSDAPYSSTHPEASWEAPQRLGTGYPGYGYENIFGVRGYTATAKDAFKKWKASEIHNDTMLTQGRWKGMKFKAIGVGIYRGFAALWFGEQVDPTGKPSREA